MTNTDDLTPPEVDERLATLWERTQKAHADIEAAKASLAWKLGIKNADAERMLSTQLVEMARTALEERDWAPWKRDEVERTLFRIEEARAAVESLRAQARPFEKRFEAERWSRFFLVQNKGGHIHSSMRCSTCFPTTRFGWLPALSGLTEADAVAAHGPWLCSVCFPSAPVEWTLGDEAEREARKAAQCPGSGTYEHDSSGLRYASPRARCNQCRQTVSVTSTGKLRAHKPPNGG